MVNQLPLDLGFASDKNFTHPPDFSVKYLFCSGLNAVNCSRQHVHASQLSLDILRNVKRLLRLNKFCHVSHACVTNLFYLYFPLFSASNTSFLYIFWNCTFIMKCKINFCIDCVYMCSIILYSFKQTAGYKII